MHDTPKTPKNQYDSVAADAAERSLWKYWSLIILLYCLLTIVLLWKG